jgi:predicted nucleic acid-binding protein
VVLVDSSVWIDALRESGPESVRLRVASLMEAGEAAWCAAVRLELWSGIRHDRERRILQQFSSVIVDLPISNQVWDLAIAMAEAGRRRGYTFPYPDLLIFGCATVHRAELFHRDSHFNALAKLAGSGMFN